MQLNEGIASTETVVIVFEQVEQVETRVHETVLNS